MVNLNKWQLGISLLVLAVMVAVITAWIGGYSNIKSFNFWLTCCIMIMSLFDYIKDGTKWSGSQLVLLLVLMVNTLVVMFY